MSGARRRLAGGASTLEERILGPHQFLEDRLEFPTGFEALELLLRVCVNRVDAGPGHGKLGARGMLGGRGAYHIRGVLDWREGLRFARALRALVSLLSGARRRLAGKASTLEVRTLGPPHFLEERLECPTGFEAPKLLFSVYVNRANAAVIRSEVRPYLHLFLTFVVLHQVYRDANCKYSEPA